VITAVLKREINQKAKRKTTRNFRIIRAGNTAAQKLND
jgi:hypothetical protein